MIQVRFETRELIKKLAAGTKQTIPDFLADIIEQVAGIEPEDYEVERRVDQKLAQGDFRESGAGKPKRTKDEFFLPDTRKEWDKLFADRWEEFGEWYEATSGNTWGGPNNYYNNLSLG